MLGITVRGGGECRRALCVDGGGGRHGAGLDIVTDPHLGDAALEHSPRTVMEALVKATAAPVSVVCSQGVVMPAVITGLAQDAGIEIEDVRVKKSCVWVLHLGADDTLLGADYLASPLPVV